MDPGVGEFLKIYGPMGIGWIVAGYLMKVIIEKWQMMIDAQVKLAVALEALTTAVKQDHGGGH